jgi:dephospho-CoA kinase
MLLAALTGNYGMGKSTVLFMFEKFGCTTIDTDRIVSSLLEEKEVLEKIRLLLSEQVFDEKGGLIKKKVADIIFKNDLLRRSLEDILHPLVLDRIENYLQSMREKDQVVVIAIPLLYERGYEDRFDRTIVIHTKEETALTRLEKAGIKREDAILRLKAQLPVEEKIKRAEFLIDNEGTMEETMAQVKTICEKLLREV